MSKKLQNNGSITLMGVISHLYLQSGFYKGSIQYEFLDKKAPKTGYIGFTLSCYDFDTDSKTSSIDDNFLETVKTRGIVTGGRVLLNGTLVFENVMNKNGEKLGMQPVIKVTNFATYNTSEEISKLLTTEKNLKVDTKGETPTFKVGKYNILIYHNEGYFDIFKDKSDNPIAEEIDIEHLESVKTLLEDSNGKKVFETELQNYLKNNNLLDDITK